MITEDYVSFETAELLKEKGFDESVNRFYEVHNGKPSLVRSEYCRNAFTTSYAAPTHQMAMKWLRKEKNIILDICPNLDLDCMCIGTYCRIVYKDNERVTLDADYDDFATYEEAVEAAIKYSLENLI